MYIPDLTERFPEGFGGVDMTDKYFPEYGASSYYDPYYDDIMAYSDIHEAYVDDDLED